MRKEYIVDRMLMHWVSKDFPGYRISPDDQMRFYSYHNPRLISGEKRSTLRFTEGGIRIPQAAVLPWVETTEESPRSGPTVGNIYINRVIVSSIRDLTKQDLALDGYSSKKRIQRTVEEIWNVWPKLDDIVSIYCFSAMKR